LNIVGNVRLIYHWSFFLSYGFIGSSQILDIQGKQVKLGVKMDKSSYIANKKIKRKKTKNSPLLVLAT